MARRPSGGLEQEVLAVLAAAPDALTPADVQAEVGDELAYTTVMTALARLHEKGIVSRERRGRAYAYRWTTDRATVTARQMRRLLDRDANRSAVLTRFVAELGPDDGRMLAELLESAPEDDEP